MTHDPTPPHVDCCLGNMPVASTRRENVSMNRRSIDTFGGYVDGVDTPRNSGAAAKAGANLPAVQSGGEAGKELGDGG
jgi:hypothetical protein